MNPEAPNRHSEDDPLEALATLLVSMSPEVWCGRTPLAAEMQALAAKCSCQLPPAHAVAWERLHAQPACAACVATHRERWQRLQGEGGLAPASPLADGLVTLPCAVLAAVPVYMLRNNGQHLHSASGLCPGLPSALLLFLFHPDASVRAWAADRCEKGSFSFLCLSLFFFLFSFLLFSYPPETKKQKKQKKTKKPIF